MQASDGLQWILQSIDNVIQRLAARHCSTQLVYLVELASLMTSHVCAAMHAYVPCVWLQDVGMKTYRLNAYQTTLGSSPQACSAECQLLLDGHIHAVAFSSTAEVKFACCNTCVVISHSEKLENMH